MEKTKIVEKKLSEITPYENNPRINDSAVSAVANSIQQFGFKVPIVVDKDSVIVCGHTRYKAARNLGMESVPCIVADDLNPEQVKAFRLADNKTAELAEWDFELLDAELEELSAIFNMEDFGFEFEEEAEKREIIEDEVPNNAPARVKCGDIWRLGEHRLYCGDSTLIASVETLMDGELADLLLTDPPYNVHYEGEHGLKIQNDNMESAQFQEFLTKAFHAADCGLRKGAVIYIWHADLEGLNFRTAVQKTWGKVRQTLIWNKNVFVMGRQDYQWKHEPCLYLWKEGEAHYFIDDRTHCTVVEDGGVVSIAAVAKMKKDELVELVKYLLSPSVSTTVIDEDKPARSAEHPTMKPLKLLAKQIRNSTREGQLVLDTFGGSGYTLMACEQLGRKCRTMEIEPHYCDVIISRWENFTGEKAELVGNFEEVLV